jgi:hypothetical protein
MFINKIGYPAVLSGVGDKVAEARGNPRESPARPVSRSGLTDRVSYPPAFDKRSHPIEAIGKLEQLLADLYKPRAPCKLPDLFGSVAVVIGSYQLCVAHYGDPPHNSPRHV